MREKISYNNEYITFGGKPRFPIMGELHYSRLDSLRWSRSLYRMKAGGVNIVSSYVIWIHHEEIEGEYDFSGNKSLREFIKCVGECGLYMFLRIGPWVHAEVRNGGFPDWLLDGRCEPRTNDERYFSAVEKFYRRIFEEVKGMFYKDGGPVIGIQIENEYGHCGGLSGDEGEEHMRRLTDIARGIGFDAPLYTATGWGGAVTGGLLPVMGAYCDAPWDERLCRLEPNPNYLFSYERNDKAIGSDVRLGYGLTFDISKFPYLTAELGGGLQSTHHRRMYLCPEDTGAMSLCKLGSGCNLLGYYMYHGGTNPHGKLTTLQESRDSGSLNDMPAYGYDGRSPLRQFGQYGAVYGELKLLALFADSFGAELCGMSAYIPEDNPKHADDLENIRYSVRHNGRSGYLFINNYQRGYKMRAHANASLSFDCGGRIAFDGLDIKSGDYYFYPFNMSVGNAVLRTARATPLTKINGDHIFYTDTAPDYRLDGDPGVKLVTLTRDEAKNAFKITLDKEYLVICRGGVIQRGNGAESSDGAESELLVYPAFDFSPDDYVRTGTRGELAVYTGIEKTGGTRVSAHMMSDGGERTEYLLDISYPAEKPDEILLDICYSASKCEIYIDNDEVDDDFCSGDGIQLELAYLRYPEKIRLVMYAAHADDSVYYEKPPVYGADGRACGLDGVSVKELFVRDITKDQRRKI